MEVIFSVGFNQSYVNAFFIPCPNHVLNKLDRVNPAPKTRRHFADVKIQIIAPIDGRRWPVGHTVLVGNEFGQQLIDDGLAILHPTETNPGPTHECPCKEKDEPCEDCDEAVDDQDDPDFEEQTIENQ